MLASACLLLPRRHLCGQLLVQPRAFGGLLAPNGLAVLDCVAQEISALRQRTRTRRARARAQMDAWEEISHTH